MNSRYFQTKSGVVCQVEQVHVPASTWAKHHDNKAHQCKECHIIFAAHPLIRELFSCMC